ncbi:MAG: aspartate 1-decarboxylase [Planctomycetota bacterium]
MLRKLMRGKIHRAVITQCDPDYVGSITIDAELLAATGIRPNEAVHVLDIDNAVRFETYVILGEPGSGIIGVTGAAAKLVETGHRVIIIAYGLLTEAEIDDHVAKVVVCDEDNRIEQRLDYASRLPSLDEVHPG